MDPVYHIEMLHVPHYLYDYQMHCFPYISYLEDSVGTRLLNERALKDLMQWRFALEFRSLAMQPDSMLSKAVP